MTTPLSVFLGCVGSDQGFLLESVEHDGQWSRFSFIGRQAHATLRSQGLAVAIDGDLPTQSIPTDKGILASVETILSEFKSPELDDLPPLTSGIVGYFGYDVVREVESLPDVPVDTYGFADSVISIIKELIVFDHWKQRMTVISVALLPADATPAQIDAAYVDGIDTLAALHRDVETTKPQPLVAPPELGEAIACKSSTSSESYIAAVKAAKDYIAAGDIFQVVLSKKYAFELETDPIHVYRMLRLSNPSPYMYYLKQSDATIVGCSPEPLVQVQGDTVISRPIAGTRPRGINDSEDKQFAASLSEDPKEIAEHVMLVDLARNDVGRVVEYGSLNIDEMMTLERYSRVMHLTSQVSGTKRPEVSVIDVLKATIPAGTVSGAPKVRAMEIIDELEDSKRGPYAGLVGYIDFSGNLDSAIAIRTMFVNSDGKAFVQAGAGVVADSVPESEDEECWNKARAILEAVAAANQFRDEDV